MAGQESHKCKSCDSLVLVFLLLKCHVPYAASVLIGNRNPIMPENEASTHSDQHEETLPF